LHLTEADPSQAVPTAPEPVFQALARFFRRPFLIHLAVLLGYVAVGIAVTWPHATYLAGKLPYTRDAGSYVWGFWWMEQSILHLHDPWLTSAIAAPVGTQLGMHALMPLAGLVLLPVTMAFGPSAAFTVLSVLLPGLMAYAMWRAARLWLPSMVGALAAGAFFGYSALLTHQTWIHLNLAAGALFLPITLEAAVRLRRRPRLGQAAVLGAVLGCSLLVDQESAILTALLACTVLLPWLVRLRPGTRADQRSHATDVLLAGLPAGPGSPRGSLSPPEPRPADTLSPPTRTSPTPASAISGGGAAFAASQQAASASSSAGTATATATAEPNDPTTTSPALPTVPAPALSPSARPALPKRAWLWLRTLPGRIPWVRFGVAALAGLIALAVAAPQIVAIMHADAAGIPSATLSSGAYLQGIRLPDMFLPSPRVTAFGLTLTHAQNTSTFGAWPTLLALIGLVLAWRKLNAWLLAGFWLVIALLAIGSDVILPSGTFTPVPQMLDGVRVSAILPFTWFVQIPGLSGFREPSRIAELGLIPVALLAGYTVNWLRYHARSLVVVVLLLGVLEAGIGAPAGVKTMPTTMPKLDRPIAADHSGSVVVDIPFGLRGGTGVTGLPFVPQAQVLATADGHPLADALLSRVPISTKYAIDSEPFYSDLLNAQTGHYNFTAAEYQIAARNAAQMHIGWVLLWVANKHLRNFLVQTGFRYLYRADGASVWWPAGWANAVLTSP
jgi:hypothetical protein